MKDINKRQTKPRIDLTDKPFGRLIVKKIAGRNKRGDILWECLCGCGNKVLVCTAKLRSGHTQSCGCLCKDINTKHGMVGTTTYQTWKSMKQRCLNVKSPAFKHYGKRGITVCDKWLLFEGFFADMGKKPKGLTIERIDNNKGYSKDNCKWATWAEQKKNQRVPKNSTTGIAGVCWNKQRKKYQAAITVNHKFIYIGRYNTLEQATIARQQAEQKYW